MNDEKKSHILFVDDEKNILEGLRRMLRSQRESWEFHFANSVDEAIDLLKDVPVDTIISDVEMPGKNGFDLLSYLQENYQKENIPVIMLTGVRDSDIKRRALDSGATDLLSKPITREDLVARISSMLRLAHFQKALQRQNETLEQKVHERTQEVMQSRMDIIWRLAKAAEFRDEETGNHVIRVGYFSALLANKIGKDQEYINSLFLTSPLHDVGKIGTPDHVLLKPGKLTPEEWDIMKRHAKIGMEILNPSFSPPTDQWAGMGDLHFLLGHEGSYVNPLLDMASEIAGSHHEKWDGSGYPKGLSGEDIPLCGRIVAIADVYDALSSKRPYKQPFPEEKVLAIFEESAGKHFDPTLYEAFLECLPRFREVRNHWSDDDVDFAELNKDRIKKNED